MEDIYWAAAKKKPETFNGLPPQPPQNPAGADKNNIVESVNNKVYFYSEVTRPKIMVLNKTLTNLNTNLINQANLLNKDLDSNIFLHINSFGGSVFAGLSAMDYIKSSSVPVVTCVEGCAASAATLMSVVGTHRVIRKNSFMLIHQLSSGMWGKYEEMKDAMENNDLFMRIITDVYEEHTKIPKKKLKEILKRDLWLDAETCLDYGMVDEIV
tara:strand:+ start:1061 stop:1696 length:636 start_codon:yes stop_codon:yes gene_type:complete